MIGFLDRVGRILLGLEAWLSPSALTTNRHEFARIFAWVGGLGCIFFEPLKARNLHGTGLMERGWGFGLGLGACWRCGRYAHAPVFFAWVGGRC